MIDATLTLNTESFEARVRYYNAGGKHYTNAFVRLMVAAFKVGAAMDIISAEQAATKMRRILAQQKGGR